MTQGDSPPMASVDVFVVASGSQANALWLRAGETAILIDAGLAAETSVRRLRAAALPTTQIAAVLLTHEHDDHARGAGALARMLDVSVVANEATLAACSGLDGAVTDRIVEEGHYSIGPFRIEAVPVSHDAASPVAFVVDAGGLRVAVATDLGSVSEAFVERGRGADLVVIEANYDLRLLDVSPYPWFLKNRILGDRGHLSNEGAAKAVIAMHAGSRQDVLLAHLSDVNNLVPLARDTVASALAEESISDVAVEALRPNRGGVRRVLTVSREASSARGA
ncbi:MAG: MBL fold metallo-hydrolase [Armatimonadetes bacterium]|nr:MBL fold metallo-hydrolase [Armatimonadota bacterium]